MASEAKRPIVNANKVPIALPKAESSQPATANLVSQDVGMHLAVGSRIRVTTAAPNQTSVEGTVYTADSTTGLLVLNVSSTPATNITPATLSAPSGSYKFIPISQISSFQLLNLLQTADSSKSAPAQATNILDANALTKRLDRAVAQAQVIQARNGPKGTTPLEQDLFNALAKTHPAHWHGTSMIISDVFVIEKPYDKASVKLLPGASGNLERMKTILDIEKNKAILKQPLDISMPSAGEGKTKGG